LEWAVCTGGFEEDEKHFLKIGANRVRRKGIGMSGQGKDSEHGCGCGGSSRREFLAAAGVTAGLIAVRSLSANAAENAALVGRRKEPACYLAGVRQENGISGGIGSIGTGDASGSRP